MKYQSPVLVGTAVLVLVLFGVALRLNGQLAASKKAEAADRSKIQTLEQEITKLKETDDFYYRQGVDLKSSGNIQDAKNAFETVASKFPTSNLVVSAQQQVTEINGLLAKQEEAKRIAEQRQREQQEQAARENGQPIEYADFYAKSGSTGLPIGKRYSFRATVYQCLMLAAPGQSWSSQMQGVASFDDPAEYEKLLRGPDPARDRNVVASIGSDGKVHIHKVRY